MWKYISTEEKKKKNSYCICKANRKIYEVTGKKKKKKKKKKVIRWFLSQMFIPWKGFM